MPIKTITVQDLAAQMQAGELIDLVDVRTPAEFREVHASVARNVPLDVFDPQELMSERNGSAGNPLYVVCQKGGRSRQACQKLVDAGYADVVSVEGGTEAWQQAGLPIETGKKTISLERQVRIAAGSLVLLGIALGVFVHPYFLGLSAFVGAGLVFAGVTDTCGMAMMLARMPWNQVKSIACSTTK